MLIDAVESSKFITQSNSDELIEKIGTLTSQYCAQELNRNISVEGRIKPGNETIYFIVEIIKEAINKGKKISFECDKYNVRKERKLKREELYVITPLHLVWNGDYYYMIGVYDYQNRLGTFHMFNREHEEVELICSNDLMDAIIDRFGDDVTIYANDMESFRVVVNVEVSHVFYSWVFGCFWKVKIKGQETVKEKYVKMIQSAYKK